MPRHRNSAAGKAKDTAMNTIVHQKSGRSIGVSPGSDSLSVQLADLAVSALLDEVQLTPKPALVDGRGSGAHKDLTLECMQRSAWSLHPTFLAMALCAKGRMAGRPLREELALLGRAGEPAMLAATGGSNAHRGAIWALGLLVAASSMLSNAGAGKICALAGEIARFPDRFTPAPPSHGQTVSARYGVLGARGEAMLGFPHVVAVGLPALRSARAKGVGETYARLDALMSIMVKLDDTCLLHRAGMPALEAAKRGACLVLEAGGSSSEKGMEMLLHLHADLMKLNASPGGAADMLAATLFLDRVDSEFAENTRN